MAETAMNLRRYVVGYVFTPDLRNVVLLHRTAGTGKLGAGQWNGVGGHVHPGEPVRAAMMRECFEEIGSGLGTMPDFRQFATIRGPGHRGGDFELSVFCGVAPELTRDHVLQPIDEGVPRVLDLALFQRIPSDQLMEHVAWMVPAAREALSGCYSVYAEVEMRGQQKVVLQL